jgi:hypothetical protein
LPPTWGRDRRAPICCDAKFLGPELTAQGFLFAHISK